MNTKEKQRHLVISIRLLARYSDIGELVVSLRWRENGIGQHIDTFKSGLMLKRHSGNLKRTNTSSDALS